MPITWPLPVSATNPMAERVPLAPVQLTVHSICVLLEWQELSANLPYVHKSKLKQMICQHDA
jgi:hypothetical protein